MCYRSNSQPLLDLWTRLITMKDDLLFSANSELNAVLNRAIATYNCITKYKKMPAQKAVGIKIWQIVRSHGLVGMLETLWEDWLDKLYSFARLFLEIVILFIFCYKNCYQYSIFKIL